MERLAPQNSKASQMVRRLGARRCSLLCDRAVRLFPLWGVSLCACGELAAAAVDFRSGMVADGMRRLALVRQMSKENR